MALAESKNGLMMEKPGVASKTRGYVSFPKHNIIATTKNGEYDVIVGAAGGHVLHEEPIIANRKPRTRVTLTEQGYTDAIQALKAARYKELPPKVIAKTSRRSTIRK